MKVTIRDANYKRGLYIFESDKDGYGVFELLERHDFNKEEELVGDFRCLGETTIVSKIDGKEYKIFMEGYGCSHLKALQMISDK